ncbi:MAG TPA: sigma-70 family RNA polymerase sigma factor [Patescibacteria group bacterium]|nr:sigma-70 family RNA polymerase sigma factor [Patescibacteria group bacterium]
MTERPVPRGVAPGRDPDLGDVRAAQADRAAFGALYRRYLDRVYGYAFYLLGDHHDAEDATERTFLAALDAIERFRDEGATFRSWLFRIAHNQIANALRSRARRRAAPLDAVAEPVADADPAREAGAADDARRVRGALAELSEDRRQVIVLRFVDGLSAREIGAVLGRSEGAVRVLQHRALRELAGILGAED